MIETLLEMNKPFAFFCEDNTLASDDIKRGDHVIIDPNKEVEEGAAALVRYYGIYTLNHVFFLDDQSILLKTDHKEQVFTKEEQKIAGFSICGAVVSVGKGAPEPWEWDGPAEELAQAAVYPVDTWHRRYDESKQSR